MPTSTDPLLQTRVTAALKKKVNRLANKSGTSVATWLRQIAMREVEAEADRDQIDFLLRYIHVLRFAWLNPSMAEAQAAIHAFERVHRQELDNQLEKVVHRVPILNGDELREALRTIDYFATCAPERWQRMTHTLDGIKELLGRP